MLIVSLSLLVGCVSPAVRDAVESRSEPQPKRQPHAVPDNEGQSDAAPEIHRVAALSVINVGDMMLGTDFPENHLPDDDGVSFLSAVTPLLKNADITIGNMEGVLMDGGIPRKQCKNPKACYLFRTPARYAQYFVDAGFDVLSLANNHARDFGEEGRTASMQNLAAAGILHTGREGDFAILRKNDMSIAVLGYAVTLNSNLLLDYDIAAGTVRQLAKSHDIVIITFHGGAEGQDVTRIPFKEEEYFGEMRGDVVKFARMMVDVGADLVVGHGPHVVRGMELYKDRLIAYSLGNFATYYGISVVGTKGIAPILHTTLDREGRFLHGRIDSTEQLRPAGPTVDANSKAYKLIRSLSIQDFTTPGIDFAKDGSIRPVTRTNIRRYTEGTLERR